MEKLSADKGGFTLLEIMVTVAIVSIMAGTATIGFSFVQTVRLRQTEGVILDSINRLGRELANGQYAQQTIHFGTDYLVVEAQVDNQKLPLAWNGEGGCGAGKEELLIDNSASTDPVYLAQGDPNGNNRWINDYASGAKETLCVDFLNSDETEWQYQLFKGRDLSQMIRFIHFNIRRDDSERVRIIGGNNFSLMLSASTLAKKFYDNNVPVAGPVIITIENESGSEIITITN